MIETILGGAVYLCAYSAGGLATGHAIAKNWNMKPETNPAPFFGGLFWPVALPILLPVFAINGLKKLRLSRFSPKLKFQEYAEAPVKVLTQILVLRIQKEPEAIARGRGHSWVWKSSDGKIEIVAIKDCYGEIDRISSVHVDKKMVSFEASPLVKALDAAIEFNETRQVAEAERDKQLAALDAVETLLLSPVQTGADK